MIKSKSYSDISQVCDKWVDGSVLLRQCREGRTKTPGETCEILMSRETFKIQKQRQTDLSWRGEWERQGRTGWRRGCLRAFLKKHSSYRQHASVQLTDEPVCVSLYVHYVFACVCMWTRVTRRVMNGMICMEMFCGGCKLSMQPVLFIAHLLFLLWLACALWLNLWLNLCRPVSTNTYW